MRCATLKQKLLSSPSPGDHTVSIFVSTYVSRPVHGRGRGVLPRMNVPLGDRRVAMAGQIRQGQRVHVGRPTRQTGVPLREWDSPARVVCFSVLDVLPTQPVALLGSVPVFQQYGDSIAQQERIGRLDRRLTSLGRAYSRPRTLVRLQQGVAQRLRGVHIRFLFGCVQYAIPVRLSGNHAHAGACYQPCPFVGECKHPAKDLAFSIDACHRGGHSQAGCIPP